MAVQKIQEGFPPYRKYLLQVDIDVGFQSSMF